MSVHYRFTAVIGHDKDGYWGECPELPVRAALSGQTAAKHDGCVCELPRGSAPPAVATGAVQAVYKAAKKSDNVKRRVKASEGESSCGRYRRTAQERPHRGGPQSA